MFKLGIRTRREGKLHTARSWLYRSRVQLLSSKYSCCSILRALQDVCSSAPLRTQHVSQKTVYNVSFRNFRFHTLEFHLFLQMSNQSRRFSDGCCLRFLGILRDVLRFYVRKWHCSKKAPRSEKCPGRPMPALLL